MRSMQHAAISSPLTAVPILRHAIMEVDRLNTRRNERNEVIPVSRTMGSPQSLIERHTLGTAYAQGDVHEGRACHGT